MSEHKTFVCSYPFQGNEYTVDVIADSFEEAQAHVTALRYARVDGELILREPVVPSPVSVIRLGRAAIQWFRDRHAGNREGR